jgi:sulfonate transport system substrate-binding protein
VRKNDSFWTFEFVSKLKRIWRMKQASSIFTNMLKPTRRDAMIGGLAAVAGLGLTRRALALSDTPPALSKPTTIRLGLFKGSYTVAFEEVPALLAGTNLKLEISNFVRYADARTALTTGSLDMATSSKNGRI